MPRHILLSDAAQAMAASLTEQAEEHGVDLTGLTYDNFNTFLDDAFNDGGEVRCEQFTDLGWPYALQYGPLESGPMEHAHHQAIRRAIEIIEEDHR